MSQCDLSISLESRMSDDPDFKTAARFHLAKLRICLL